MPSRQISSQSFDDILSELGDDPAIPDPHGIRKPSAPPRPKEKVQVNAKTSVFSSAYSPFKDLKIAPLLAFGAALTLLSIGLFLFLESNQTSSDAELRALQSQLSSIQKELDLAKLDWESDREELYEEIDEIEVSIHLLDLKAPLTAPQPKPALLPHEAELRRWRYLGLIRMNNSQQAFFHNGKTSVMVSRGGVILGGWLLTEAQKDMATLTHPKGKSITLKPSKSE